MSRYFRVAPFDPGVFVNTIVFIAALAFFGVPAVWAYANGGTPTTFDLGASAILTAVIAYAWLRSIRGYRVTNSELVIERAGPGKLRIPITSIERTEPRPDIGNFSRSGFLSIQGLFGWAGKVNIRKPTETKATDADVYGTNQANSVALDLSSGLTIILTPRDTQGFVDALREAGVGVASKPTTRPAASSWTARKKSKSR